MNLVGDGRQNAEDGAGVRPDLEEAHVRCGGV